MASMQELCMLKGLPGSGKSTLARQMVDESYFRVSLDDIRAMVHNGWTKENEKIVQAIETEMVQMLLDRGCNVVIDDTNVTRHHYNKWKKIADPFCYPGIVFTVKVVDTPIEECIRRDKLREGDACVGWEVIHKLANKWEDMPNE